MIALRDLLNFLAGAGKFAIMAALVPLMSFTGTTISKFDISNPPSAVSGLSKKPKKYSLLKETCKHGDLEKAFNLVADCFPSQNPSNNGLCEAYSVLLELCASQKALSQGKQIHAQVLKSSGVYDSQFLDTKLVYMYGKCGSVLDAEKVFDRMPERSIFSWNAMLGACVSNDKCLEALKLYEGMRRCGFPLDTHTFSCVIKACAGIEDLRCGHEIHGLAIKLGFMSNVFVVNSLVGMYGKCNDVHSAERLFNKMSLKEDVVSWNSILSSYVTNDMSIEALRIFEEMLYTDTVPSTYTFVAVLQACEDPLVGKLGKAVHAIILKYGHHLDIYVANALVVMYTRNGKMDEAARVFHDIEEKDNVSWNTMLSGFVQNGLYDDAFDLFCQLKSDGWQPDEVSIISMLAACGRSESLLLGMEMHACALKNRMDFDLEVSNTLMDMYAKCGRIDYMDFVFHRISCRDHISWTTAISGYSQNNCLMKALQLFREMQMEKMEIDLLIIGSVLLACCGLKCNSLIKEVHGYVIRRGCSDLVTANSLVDSYGNCGNVDYAHTIFREMEVKNIVSFTSMISCYVHNGFTSEAIDLVYQMKEADIELDSVAILSILSVVANLSALRKAKEIHGFLLRKGFLVNGSIASSLVDTYASCGTLDYAITVFNSVSKKDMSVWTSMINAYGMHGCGREAIGSLKRMEDENLFPDHIAFLVALYACSHSALVDEGKQIFESMQHDYKLEPWPEHYTCMVDMLGRANYIEEAYEFTKTMRTEPTAAVWSALLGACQVHSHEEVGKIAACKLLELEPQNPGNYVLISNSYAAKERWRDVEEVRKAMKKKGLKKDPACSWIEIGNEVHVFTAHDRSHPKSDEIYQKLDLITEKLRREGYVPQTKYVLHNLEEKEKIRLLYGHSERLAISFGLLKTAKGTPIRITKNLRICGDCHTFSKLTSKYLECELIVRDANRFHHFKNGVCSCGDFW